MNLHSEGKQKRREAILKAAEQLLVSGGHKNLAMRKLAQTAGVSEATPYNLFGSKVGIITALLEGALYQMIEESFTEAPNNPIERLLVGAEKLGQSWTKRSDYFRELILAGRESGGGMAQFSAAPISMLEAGITDALKAGLLETDLSAKDIARHIHLSNQGAFDSWADNQSADAELVRDLLLGVSISLLSISTIDTRQQIISWLNTRT